MSTMANIFDNQYSLDKSRIFTDIICKLRNEVYPKEIEYIQSGIINSCDDIESIEVMDGNNVIILTPKNKKKGINKANLLSVLYTVVGDIYQRNIINNYGKDHPYSKIDIDRLFAVVSYGEQVKVML